MQVTEQMNVRAGSPRFTRPPVSQPTRMVERPSFRCEPEGLSREELQKIVLEMLG
jgi:hypothetical protein